MPELPSCSRGHVPAAFGIPSLVFNLHFSV